MRLNTLTFEGARLSQARKARGLTAVTLADVAGITSAAISRYEHSKDTPRGEILQVLSEKLNVPVAFFFLPTTKSDEERCIKWRSLSSATKSARERGEVRYDWLKSIVTYFDAYFDLPRLNVPTFNTPTDFRDITYEHIDGAANYCREAWGLGEKKKKNLVLLLENNGVIVSRGFLGTNNQDAFSEWSKDDRPYVFLGADKNVCVRSRFDAAHELGHLILHKGIGNDVYRKPEFNKLIEQQANRFAASFLMPKHAFFSELWAPTLDAFTSLKSRWKVSVKGMIVHSHRHGILGDSQYQRMMINYNRKWKNGEPLDDTLPCEKPRLLARCIDGLLDSKIKDKSQILTDLSLSASDIEELVGIKRGALSDSISEIISIIPKLKENPIVNQKKDGKIIQMFQS